MGSFNPLIQVFDFNSNYIFVNTKTKEYASFNPLIQVFDFNLNQRKIMLVCYTSFNPLIQVFDFNHKGIQQNAVNRFLWVLIP